MRDRELENRAIAAAKLATKVAKATPPALSALRDDLGQQRDRTGVPSAAGVLGAGAYDAPIVAGGEGSDPTGSLAQKLADARPSNTHAMYLRAEIETRFIRVASDLEFLLAALGRCQLLDAKEAKKLQQEREDLAIANDECCRSCHRTYVAPGVRRQEPKHAARFVDGEAWKLCRWCVRFADRTGRLPSIEEVEGHHDTTRRVRKPA